MDDLLALMEGSDEGLQEDDDMPVVNTQSPVSTADPPQLSRQNNNNNNNNDTIPSRVTPVAKTSNDEQPSSSTTTKKKKKKKETTETKVDHQLGIRMTERKIGSLDLLELVQTRNYHSPAVLAAMSLATLNQQVLIEPALVVGPANVCGNTNLCTIGIVFSNSGTKIAAKGNAFCVVTMGSNLQTGPCVSVLLFGPAYSKYCREIKPGMVIALENPRLIPPKPTDAGNHNTKFQNNSNDTAISFSINDERRLMVVAIARDYGVCQAMVKGKNAQGHWVNNAKRCSTAIDIRAGKYCFHHRNLANVNPAKTNNNTSSSSSSSSNNNAKGTFMQQQRQQLNIQPLRMEGRPLILPNNKNTILDAPITRSQPVNSRLQGVPRQMSRLKTPDNTVQTATQHSSITLQQPLLSGRADGLVRARPTLNNRPTNNSILNVSSTSQTKKTGNNNNNHTTAAGLARLTRQAFSASSTNRLLNPSLAITQENPYKSSNPIHSNTRQQRQPQSQPLASSNRPPKNSNPVLDWLPAGNKKKKSTSSTNSTSSSSTTKLGTSSSSSRKAKPKLNTSAMGGFDGQVAVPKPSRLFAASTGCGGASSCINQSLTFMHQPEQDQRPLANDILSKQSRLAEQLKNTKAHNKATVQSKSANIRGAVAGGGGGFFDFGLVKDNPVLQNLDRDAILHAKSRFASEADAEAYATSRRRLTELEQEEARKEAAANKKNNTDNTNKTNGTNDNTASGNKKVVEKEWVCKTCNNKRTKFEPKSCIRQRHSIVCKRILNKKNETVADKRIKLTTTAAQDGGLQLGSGIEWSRLNTYNRFS